MSNLLQLFRYWFERNEVRLRAKGVEFSISDPGIRDNQWVDMDSKGYIARITLWIGGECDMEVIERKSGDRILWENTVLRNLEEMEDTFQRFIGRLLELK
jgi:hypothetical protein